MFDSFSGLRGWLHRVPVLSGILLVLMLTACGGSDGPEPLPKMSADEAVNELVGAARHPAALAIRVTPAEVDVRLSVHRTVNGVAVGPDDRFPAGSLTKSMTATLAGVLVQDGWLSLDSKLLEVLPEVAMEARSDYSGVTLRDLLAHRSGMFAAATPEEISQLPELAGTPRQQRLQLIEWALERVPSIAPGKATEYSNGGYVAAAAMMERVTGLDYETLLQERVFAPLAASVEFGAPGSTGGPQGHGSRDGTAWTPFSADDPLIQFPAFANPAGGALLRGSDLAAFLQMHLRALNSEAGQLLDPQTARELHTAVQDGYALGWLDGKDLDGRPVTWHNGSDDLSYYALMSLSTEQGVASAAMVNGLGPDTETAVSRVVSLMLR